MGMNVWDQVQDLNDNINIVKIDVMTNLLASFRCLGENYYHLSQLKHKL